MPSLPYPALDYQEHLTCFLPGTLALGHMAGLDPGDHLSLAKDLTKTCYEMYRRMPTGLSPEVAAMNMSPTGKEDMYVNVSGYEGLRLSARLCLTGDD